MVVRPCGDDEQEVGEAVDRAEFRVLRESLGLTGAEVAAACGVGARAVRRWEHGGSVIGEEYAGVLRDLVRRTDRQVAALAARAKTPRLVTYATNEAFLADHPGSGFTAAWHRGVVARVARQVPGAVIVFAEDSWVTGS